MGLTYRLLSGYAASKSRTILCRSDLVYFVWKVMRIRTELRFCQEFSNTTRAFLRKWEKYASQTDIFKPGSFEFINSECLVKDFKMWSLGSGVGWENSHKSALHQRLLQKTRMETIEGCCHNQITQNQIILSVLSTNCHNSSKLPLTSQTSETTQDDQVR